MFPLVPRQVSNSGYSTLRNRDVRCNFFGALNVLALTDSGSEQNVKFFGAVRMDLNNR